MTIPGGLPPLQISSPTVSGSGDAGSGVDHAVNINVASPRTPAAFSIPWPILAVVGAGAFWYFRGRK